MRIIKLQAIFIICICFAFICRAQTNITNYKVYIAIGTYNGKQILVTRKFDKNGEPNYFYVDVNSMKTAVLPLAKLTAGPTSWQQAIITYANTPYIKALVRARDQSFALQDAGIIHGYPKEKGITLTIDLCP